MAMGSVTAISRLSHLFLPHATCNTTSLPPIKTQLNNNNNNNNNNNQHSIIAKVSLSGDATTKTEFVVDDVSSPISDDLRLARVDHVSSNRYVCLSTKFPSCVQFSGYVSNTRVEGFNGGGLLVRFYSLVGFLPYPHLSPSHSGKEPNKSIQEIAKALVGSLIPVKVIQVDEDQRKLIFSEKEALWSRFSQNISLGDIFVGKVGSIEDYGAFIHLLFPDGSYHLTGLVHVSEVSWDLVRDVRDILSEGDEVRVKVIKIDRVKSRITLSIKQLEDDPLFETLEKVIPQNGSAVPDSSGTSSAYNIEPLPGLEAILEELKQEDGIIDVRISRQGFEKRVVSQDLQLWLSNAPAVGNQFVLLARAGRQVQEIQLTTSLDQDGIKRALQRVLERVP